MPSVTSVRMRSVSSSSARASLAQASTSSTRSVDVDGLEQLDLALDREVGPPAGGVGQRAGVVDAAQQLDQPATTEVVERRPATWPSALG